MTNQIEFIKGETVIIGKNNQFIKDVKYSHAKSKYSNYFFSECGEKFNFNQIL